MKKINMLLTLKRDVLPPKQGVEKQRAGCQICRKNTKNLNNLHFGSSHSQTTSQKTPEAGRSQIHLGVFLSKKQTLLNKTFSWLKVLLT